MMNAMPLLFAALTALAASACAQSQGQGQSGVTVQHSPPAIVAVPPTPPAPAQVTAPTPVAVISPPRHARGPLQSLISPADYPISALANREQGRVEFRLDIGPSGRVHSCTITRSSGSAALDSATCRIIRSRARYMPGRDSSGAPAGYSVEDSVEWRLPVEEAERG